MKRIILLNNIIRFTTKLLIVYLFFFVTKANAASCDPAPGDSTHSITTDCSFTYDVDGLDSGIGSTNDSVLSIDSGVLTILGTQDIAAGSVELNGGSISIISGGAIHLGDPIYATDVDTDTYIGGYTFYLTNVANTVRRNTLSTYDMDCNDNDSNAWTMVGGYLDSDGDGYGSTISGMACTDGSLPSNMVANSTDCDDSSISKWQILCGHADSDGDGYGASAISNVCSGASLPSGYTTNSSDCYDGNSNAKPGSTYCASTHRGDGSYDYNCSGGNTRCSTTFYPGSVITDNHWSDYLRRCNNYGSKTVVLATTGAAGCGVSGYTRSTYRSADCGTPAYYLLGTSGTQACQ